ncbi:MAG: hypothetical protein ACOCUA_01175 [archaeon]
MPPEECGICGAAVALGDAAHVMLNAKSEAGVRDYYVCPTCFEEELLPHFPDPAGGTEETDGTADDETGETSPGAENADATPADESDPTGPATDADE